jgi:hypothetical protein
MAYGEILSDKITTSDGVSSAGVYGLKNRLINSDMRIDQRNVGASVSMSSVVYPVDRWLAFEDTDGTMTAQRSTVAPAGFTNSILITTTSADSSLGATQYARLCQRIEGFNIADLAWGTASAATVTLSFWVRSSLTGTFGGALTNSAFNRSYPFTYTISSANTWEQKSVTIAGDTSGTWLTDNGIGLEVDFGLGVGSTYSGTAGAWTGSGLLSATGATSVVGTNGATFYVTGVQLEKGSTATSFDYRSYGIELALCQRYFQALTTYALSYTTSVTAGYQYLIVYFPTIMRANPTYNLQSGSWLGATATFEGSTTSNARFFNATTGFYSNGGVVTAFSSEL